MFELFLAGTGLVLGLGIVLAYRQTRDVLHPMMFLGPLFLYGTVLDPWLVENELDRFFANRADVNLVLLLDFLAVIALVLGALHDEPRRAGISTRPLRTRMIDERQSTMLVRLAAVLGTWGLVSYSAGILNAGGFAAAFATAKGGGYSASGYLSEGMNLSVVAVVMAALSRYRRGWTPSAVGLVALGLFPNLVQGTFGGRRGPLFLALTASMLAWFIARRRKPGLSTLWPALAAACLAVVFVGSQRHYLHLGTDQGVHWEQFTDALTQQDVDQGNNFIYGAGFVLATRHAGEFTWGKELAVNLLVRPIPKQLWPTKYEDAGATWVTSNYPGLGHLTRADWLGAVGWLPLAGSSAISISDIYGEFGWGTVIVFYLIGRGFAELRLRRRMLGGMWELLYLESLTLSIYLATQSFSAFYYRYLILSVPTTVAWKLFVERRPGTGRRQRQRLYRGASPQSVST